jgi:hypothetical protein
LVLELAQQTIPFAADRQRIEQTAARIQERTLPGQASDAD